MDAFIEADLSGANLIWIQVLTALGARLLYHVDETYAMVDHHIVLVRLEHATGQARLVDAAPKVVARTGVVVALENRVQARKYVHL